MSFLAGLFAGNKDGQMPSMATLMVTVSKYFTSFQKAGKDKEKIKAAVGQVVTDLATEKNIRMCTEGLVNGLNDLQTKTNQRFVLYAEGTTDNKDILVRIWERPANGGALIPYKDMHIRHIQQKDIFDLINIIFNAGNGDTTDNN